MNLTKPTYLGDSVYISPWPEGDGVKLTTDNHEEAFASNIIYLDESVLARLLTLCSPTQCHSSSPSSSVASSPDPSAGSSDVNPISDDTPGATAHSKKN